MTSEQIQRLADLGITTATRMQAILFISGNQVTMTGLAGACGISTGGATPLVDNMEKDGLVSRVRHPQDRRVINIELTEKGQKALVEIKSI